MVLCPPSWQNRESGKLPLIDAEDASFVRVNHIDAYGVDPHLDKNDQGVKQMPDRGDHRREFLKQSTVAIVAATASSNASPPSAEAAVEMQPEELWHDRMTPPDDGKKFGWFVDTRRCFFVDTRRCFGCHGCEVSCKAENDVPLGQFIRQTFYKPAFPR
jgi:hypothetical protein